MMFQEDEDVERIFTTIRSIKKQLGHCVNVECDVTTPEELSMAN